jgi:hypothetical protein
MVKRKMIKGIDKSELVLLVFKRSEATEKLHWEHAREFEYAGQMYDVVETLTTADSIYYHCWPDNQETHLNKKLNDWVASVLGSDKKHRQNSQLISEFYKMLYDLPFPRLCLPDATCDKSQFREKKYSLVSVHTFPPVPPPEQA